MHLFETSAPPSDHHARRYWIALAVFMACAAYYVTAERVAFGLAIACAAIGTGLQIWAGRRERATRVRAAGIRNLGLVLIATPLLYALYVALPL